MADSGSSKLSLRFGRDANLQEIKSALAESRKLQKLELSCCKFINDKALLDIAPKLNEELTTFTASQVSIGTKGLKALTQRCPFLHHIKFIDCPKLTQECLKVFGSHCQKLKTVAFVYEQEDGWKLVDDVLSLLVKNLTSELVSISFVGFNSVTDIGVNYVAECYYSSLQKINFNHCSQLTDKSLEGLATYCKLLREVSVNSTAISDSGVNALAEKCLKLHRVDFGNCGRVTDLGVKTLAKKCISLEQVNLENCSLVSDASLVALATHCSLLQHLNFNRTSLKSIPALILTLRRLREINLKMCKELSHPPPEIVERELAGLLEFYKEYNLSYRLKVFFLGHSGGGKSSLVQTLYEDTPQLVKTPTEGVDTCFWQPFQDSTNVQLVERKLKLDEKQLVTELWDLSGRQVCQPVHQVFLTPGALYVIVFNLADQASCDNLYPYLGAVQNKAPGSHILLVATHADQFPDDEHTRKKAQEVLLPLLEVEERWIQNIKTEIAALKLLELDLKIYNRLEELQHQLQQRPQISKRVHLLSCKTGQGLENLKREFFHKCLDYDSHPHLARQMKPGTIQLYDEILKHRSRGSVLLPWEEYKEMAEKEDFKTKQALRSETQFLAMAGGVLDLPFVDFIEGKDVPTHYICINPPALANLSCLMHVDDNRKSFKIEARRFWPRDSGCRKPDPSVLVKALEDIPGHGMIREALFPLLWQSQNLTEEQVKMMLDVLQRLGLLVLYSSGHLNQNGLALPNFPSLKASTKYYAPVMGLLPINRPQLNWTPKPFKGDIQLNWRYMFPSGTPPGILPRLTAVCHRSSQGHSYQYYWSHGVLLRTGEAMICISHESKYIDICCRVNADETGQEKSSVEFLWAHISLFINAAELFLSRWSGLFYKTCLVPLGLPFYYGDVVVAERGWPLFECLDYLHKETNISFTDEQLPRELDIKLLIPFNVAEFEDIDSWIRYILNKRETVFSLLGEDDDLSGPVTVQRSSDRAVSRVVSIVKTDSSKRKKKPELKWKLDGSYEPEHNGKLRRMSSTDRVGQPISVASGALSPTKWEEVQEETAQEVEEENVANDDAKMPNEVTATVASSVAANLAKIQEDTDSGVVLTPEKRSFSLEEEIQETRRLASGFVAAILAGATADYIRLQHEDNHTLRGHVTSAQVSAAKVTAEAAMATQMGHVEDAANAVISAAVKMQEALDKQEQEYKNIKSKLCVIL